MTDAAADLTALAAGALDGVAEPGSVGPLVDAVEREPGVVDLAFECLLPGYPGWRWVVSTARVAGEAPTVLETELLPGDGALLAPPWVPWAERLAEYRRTHGDAGEEDLEGGADDGADDDLDEEDDVDEDEDEDDDDDDEGIDDDLDDDDLDDGVDVEAAAGQDGVAEGDEGDEVGEAGDDPGRGDIDREGAADRR